MQVIRQSGLSWFDISDDTKKGVSFAEDVKQFCTNEIDSINEQWDSYLAMIQIAPKATPDKEFVEAIVMLAEKANKLLAAPKCRLNLSQTAKGTQLDALLNHVRLLLDHEQPKLAHSLLAALLERKVVKSDFEPAPTLWVRAATGSMNSPEVGLISFEQARTFHLNWAHVTDEFLDAFCRQLANLLEKNEKLNERITDILFDFLSNQNFAVSCRKELSAVLFSNLKSQGFQFIGKQFSKISGLIGLQSLTPYIQTQLQKHLDDRRLGPAINLLIQTLSLDPLPISKENARSYIYQIVIMANNHPVQLYFNQISKALKEDRHMEKFIPDVGEWLVDQKRFPEAKAWLNYLIINHISVSSEWREVFAGFVISMTWHMLKEEEHNPDRPVKDSIGHGLLSYADIMKGDSELLIELASTLKTNLLHLRACECLYSNIFENDANQRNALFRLIIQEMIKEGENEDVLVALSKYEESNGFLDILWKEFVEKLFPHCSTTTQEYNDFSKALRSCTRQDAIPEYILQKGLEKAVERDDRETCFTLLTIHKNLHEHFCKYALLPKIDVEKAGIWINFVDYLADRRTEHLAERRSMILKEMVKQDPSAIAGELFKSFDMLPEEQCHFFNKLLIASAAITDQDDYDAFIDILALRRKIEPLYLSIKLFSHRIACDVALSSYLVRAKQISLFMTGVTFALDVTSKLYVFATNSAKSESWKKVMSSKAKFPHSPLIVTAVQINEVDTKCPEEKVLKELRAYSRETAKEEGVRNMILNITYRTNDFFPVSKLSPDLTLNDNQTNVLANLWPWLHCCGVSIVMKLTLATNITILGKTNHLKDFEKEIVYFIQHCFGDVNLFIENKDIVYASLQLLAQYKPFSDDNFGLSDILSNEFVKEHLTHVQLTHLWNNYLIHILPDCTGTNFIIWMELFIKQLPNLVNFCAIEMEKKTFPASIDAGLNALASICLVKPKFSEFVSVQDRFFQTLPKPHYDGSVHKQKDKGLSADVDYTLIFKYLEQLFRIKSECNANTPNAYLAVHGILTKLILDVPQNNEAVRKEMERFVSRYIAKYGSGMQDPKKRPGSAAALWNAALGAGLFKDSLKNDELSFLATGKVPSKVDKGENLVKLYAEAIQLAASEGNFKIALQLSTDINKNPEAHQGHLVAALYALLRANMILPLEYWNNELSANFLLTLQKSWLIDQPIETIKDIHNIHIELLTKIRKESTIITRIYIGQAEITKLTPAAIESARGLSDAMRFGIEKGDLF